MTRGLRTRCAAPKTGAGSCKTGAGSCPLDGGRVLPAGSWNEAMVPQWKARCQASFQGHCGHSSPGDVHDGMRRVRGRGRAIASGMGIWYGDGMRPRDSAKIRDVPAKVIGQGTDRAGGQAWTGCLHACTPAHLQDACTPTSPTYSMKGHAGGLAEVRGTHEGAPVRLTRAVAMPVP